MGHLEDRGVGVVVNGDDDIRGLHTGQVLYSAGNAAGDVELGANGLAGLSYLV